MRPFQPACWCLIIILSVDVQPRHMTLTNMVHGHRLSSSLSEVRGGLDRTVALDNTASQPEEGVARRTAAPGEAPVRLSEAAPEQNDRVPEGGPGTPRRGPRARRHANHAVGRSHVHLMRVGCVLGTCQVQNLSHRLHQLIGRRGREDSSPINPRSPHSYG
ncbi:protein ADM2 [Gadus morhua]|uniref:protein ADM2 n=1 Tax=Gadus morhua TaxID=8049 RepID=UPI0011B6F67E|nr:protein ADM2-like [Gadus morhua]